MPRLKGEGALPFPTPLAYGPGLAPSGLRCGPRSAIVGVGTGSLRCLCRGKRLPPKPTQPHPPALPGRLDNRSTAKRLPAPATVADDVKSLCRFSGRKEGHALCKPTTKETANSLRCPAGSCPPPRKRTIKRDLTKGSVSRFLVTLFKRVTAGVGARSSHPVPRIGIRGNSIKRKGHPLTPYHQSALRAASFLP